MKKLFILSITVLISMLSWSQKATSKSNSSLTQKKKSFVSETFTIDGLMYDTKEDETGTYVVVYADKDNKPTGSLAIPGNVTYKGNTYGVWLKKEAFKGCDELVSVTIPDNIGQIAPEAFCNCTKLASVILPSKLGWIKYGAFQNCKSLKSIELPESVNQIDFFAFYGCESLTTINLPNGVLFDRGDYFSACYNLEKPIYNKTTFVRIPYKYTGRYIIPNGIRTIARTAFVGCKLSEITIPTSVTRIEMEAFRSCDNLKYIYIPDNVKEIGSMMFNECHHLTGISIPSHLVGKFSKDEFGNCRELKTVVIRFQDGTERVCSPENIKE